MYELYSQNGHSSSSNSQDVLIKVQGVSKKFCRSLKRSLWYGVQDVASDLNPFRGSQPENSELRHDEFWAVNDVSFELRRGECLGLIGGNGAGKTTLLKMLNGLIKPDKGRIEMRGRVGALIALGAGFNPILTGRENIYVNGSVLGLRKKEIDAKFDEIVDFSGVEEFIDMPVQSYSSGMQVRLGFAIAATAIQPNTLLIDEVLAVGDVSFQAKCINVIKRLQSNGASIVLVSHNMTNILRYCSSGFFLKNGQGAAAGSIDTVVAEYCKDQDAVPENVNVSHPLHSGHYPVVDGFELGKIHALDCHGQEREQLSADEPLILAIPVTYNERPDEKIEVDLDIFDTSGLLCKVVSPPLDLPATASDGTLVIHMHIDWLPVTDGRLTVGVAIWTPGKRMLLGGSHNNVFHCQGKRPLVGRLAIPASWYVSYVQNPGVLLASTKR